MHDCISPCVRNEATAWLQGCGDSEWGAGVRLAMTAQETVAIWLAAAGWWADSPDMGQRYLFQQIGEALQYFGGVGPGIALEWRDKTLKHLQALSDLIAETPDQYLGWWELFEKSENERILGELAHHNRCFVAYGGRKTNAFQEAREVLRPDIETMNADYWPLDPVKTLAKTLKATKYQQGPTPLRPADSHAKRAYFVRRLCATLSPVTDEWPDVIRALAVVVFESDMKRSQVIALADGVRPDNYEKESFELRFAENKR